VTFGDIAWLREVGRVPVIVKGVLRADDALARLDAGAAAVAVSNHGGRQLDGALATADALPEIVAAVAGRGDVYVDGGIRRGSDVLKALALGARAVMVGRPVLWGLATGGAQGVTRVLDDLRRELLEALALCGVSQHADLSPDLVAHTG
jgi:4-hydroxymandelate oxidase